MRDQTKLVPAMNMAAAYSALTVTQLKGMLGAALADHRREMEETKAKWSAEVSALREAASKNSARLTSELQATKNQNAASSVSSTLFMSSWSRRAP